MYRKFVKTVDKSDFACYNYYRRHGQQQTSGGLAQLGERLHGMQEVTGSIPVISTKKALYFVGSMVLFFFLKPVFGTALLRLRRFQAFAGGFDTTPNF